jgi:hypothetical protein
LKSRIVGLDSLQELNDEELEAFISDYEFVAKLAKLKPNSLDKVVRLFFKKEKYYQQNFKAVAAVVGETILIDELDRCKLLL